MTEAARSNRLRRLLTVVPVLLVVAVGIVTITNLRSSDEPQPVAVSANGPRFTSLAELFAASDVVVEATVIAVDDGRTITDPANPAAGFSTRLFHLQVVETFRGGDSTLLVVEQEAELLDGTPIVVNEMSPNRIGDHGFWFLVRGDDEHFPYVAVVNEQGRLLVDNGDRLGPVDVEGVTGVGQFREALSKLAETSRPVD